MKQDKQKKFVPYDTLPPRPSGWEDISFRLGILSFPFSFAAWFFYCVFFGSMLWTELQYLMMTLSLGLIGMFPVLLGILALRKKTESRKARIGVILGVIVLISSLCWGVMFFLSLTRSCNSKSAMYREIKALV